LPENDDAADTALLVGQLREAGEIARRYFGGTLRRGWRCWHWAAGDGVRDYNF